MQNKPVNTVLESIAYEKKNFELIQIGNREDSLSKTFDIFISVTIVLNIAVLFLETFDEMSPYYDILHLMEMATIVVFCLEYALRIWTSEYLYPDCSKGRSVWRFILSYDGIIDLLAILPFFFFIRFHCIPYAPGREDLPFVQDQQTVRFFSCDHYRFY